MKIIDRLLRTLLPEDRTFWKLYSPVIRILRDSHEHRLIRQKMSQYLNLSKSDKVLEEGCGKAVWLSEVQARVAETIGVDGELGMLREARSVSPRSRFVLANLDQDLPFRSEHFTKIGSILVEGYLRKPELLRSESFRVLAPGGMMAVVTPRKGARFFRVLSAEAKQRKQEQTVVDNLRKLPLAVIAVIFGKMAELKAVIGDWHFYEKEELMEAYRRAGFEIVACESVYAEQAWLLVIKKPSQFDAAS